MLVIIGSKNLTFSTYRWGLVGDSKVGEAAHCKTVLIHGCYQHLVVFPASCAIHTGSAFAIHRSHQRLNQWTTCPWT